MPPSTHTHTHQCRADEWQGKECDWSRNDDDVVSVVPQPLQQSTHFTHDSPGKTVKKPRGKKNCPEVSQVTQSKQLIKTPSGPREEKTEGQTGEGKQRCAPQRGAEVMRLI